MNILNVREYIEHFLKIRTKDQKVQLLKLNPPQQRLYEKIRELRKQKKPIRIIILKARQLGFSTVIEAILFALTATSFYFESMIVAHKEEATANLYRMSRMYYDNLPAPMKPMLQSSNAQELSFDRPARYSGKGKGLHSRIRCATAGGQGVGRSYTLQCLHLSEYAFWPGNKKETLAGLLQAVPDSPDTAIFIESTANGYDDFKTMWDNAVENEEQGRDGFVPIFFAWFEMPEYRRTVPEHWERTEEERELAETFGLDDEQLAWRRWTIATNFDGDIDMFHQEYPSTPDEAFIATGSCVFNKKLLVLRREQTRKLKWETGDFRADFSAPNAIESFRWVPDPRGHIRILKHPEKNVPYVLGGDTAGEGSDWFAGHVIDNTTGEVVAVLHQQMDERSYAVQMYCLGMYYNEALIGVEVNFSTYPEMRLEDLRYPNLYVREQMDTYTGQLRKSYGFRTSAITRPVIIDTLKDVANHETQKITDYKTLGEMLTFVRDKQGKPQAEEGEHDDLVMSLAITYGIRGQQRLDRWKEEKMSKWTASMREDYRNASPAEREYLLRKWGSPTGG